MKESVIQGWGFWKRAGFRFVFVYFVVYLLPFPLDHIPPLEPVAERYNQAWYKAVPWIGRNILHLPYEITEFPGGSGDTTFNYVQLLCFVTIAAAIAAIWSFIDHRFCARRPLPQPLGGRGATYACLHDWLRVYVRFYLGLTLFDYGVGKDSQFPFPDLDRWIQPVGHYSPMGLLWTFMGTSPAYRAFTGVAECIGGLLLLWRRTTTLGALITAGVMGNVVMLDLCYDVPAKLFATHLLLLALFLLLPDMGRLINFLLLNRPTAPAMLGRPFDSRRLNRAAAAVKVLFVCFMLGQSVWNTRQFASKYRRDLPRPALYGLYEVEAFARNGDPIAPAAADAQRWRRVVVNRYGVLAIQLWDDSVQRFSLKDDPGNRTIELTSRVEPARRFTLVYTKEDAEHLLLEGEFEKDRIRARLGKTAEPRFLLLDRGFHWISERPFVR